ncbi:exonuclease domain-containing protein [Vibrio astriarenae]
MKAIDYYIKKIEGFENMDFEERRYWLEYHCLDKDKKHTKATLKGLFRLKPKADAKRCGSYKNDYSQQVDLFYAIDCIPMRNVSKKTRTLKQKAATQKLIASNLSKSPKGKAIELCKKLVTNDAIVIDTETTDLHGVAIQIALVSCKTREVLFKSYIATDEPISSGAFEVHGICNEMLVDAPSAAEVQEKVTELCEGRYLVAFNAIFDELALDRTFEDVRELKNWTCAMFDVAVPVFGYTNRYGTISLSRAMSCAGIEWRGEAHDAASDALAAADLIYKIAKKEAL